MSDSVVCPKCTRDYELPRRFLVRADDIEFLCVPRKLGCLHTCCQSCLEDMWQKSNMLRGISSRNTMTIGSVSCPQCEHQQTIKKGVQYLPLDGSALSEIIPLNGTNLSFCSRCHDEVPSYSWCGECSVTLCEFHHQDHKLSYNTSRHKVQTFKDISHHHVVIEPRMPPISCPQELEQDATLYCEECSGLLSAKAMMSDEHKGHKYCEASSMIESSIKSIEETMVLLKEREKGLINAMKNINDNIEIVKYDMENSMKDIEVVFAKIHEDLESREHALLQRLQDISNRKTSILTQQLNDMEDALEKCRHSLNVSNNLLTKCDENTVKGGGMYIVNLFDSILSRTDEIDEVVVNIPFEPQVDPYIRASFVKDEIEVLHSVLLSLGSLLTNDNTPAIDNLEKRSPRHDGDEEEGKEDEQKVDAQKIVDNKGRHTFSALSRKKYKEGSGDKNMHKIPFQASFTVRTEDPPPLSNFKTSAFSKEAVVIEVRIHHDNGDCGEDGKSNLPKQVTNSISLDDTLGEVVGEVVILTEVDKRYLKKHIVRSNYESFLGSGESIPVLRLTREIVTCI